MRLELTKRADYAVRAAVVLAAAPEQHTGASIAADAEIPRSFLPQVMGDLVRAGIVERRVGRGGGYRLRRPAREVTLLEVIEAVEGDSRRQSCVLRGGPCGRDGHCQAHGAFFAAQEALIGSLRSARLSDVVAEPDAGLPMP